MIPDALVGAWARESIAVGDGRPAEPCDVVWVQTRSSYADLRVPRIPGSRPIECFAGRTTWAAPTLRWSHDIDLAAGPAAAADEGVISWEDGALVERGVLSVDGAAAPYVEVWRRLPGSDGPVTEQVADGFVHVGVGDHELIVHDRRGAGVGFSAIYRCCGEPVRSLELEGAEAWR